MRLFILPRNYGRLGNILRLLSDGIGAALESGAVLLDCTLGERKVYFEGIADQIFPFFPPQQFSMKSPEGHLLIEIFLAIQKAVQVDPSASPELQMHTERLLTDPALRENLSNNQNCYFPQAISNFGYVFAEMCGRGDIHHPQIRYLTTSTCASNSFSRELASLPAGHFALFDSFEFRDYPLAVKHREQIRSYLAPKTSIADWVEGFLKAAREGADRVVGVHIRRGDFREWQGGKFLFSPEDFLPYMKRVETLYSSEKIHFVLTSDEPIAQSDFPGCKVFVSDGDLYQDIFLLAGCDLIIGSPSSFSTWAAYYGGISKCTIGFHSKEFELAELDDARLLKEEHVLLRAI